MIEKFNLHSNLKNFLTGLSIFLLNSIILFIVIQILFYFFNNDFIVFSILPIFMPIYIILSFIYLFLIKKVSKMYLFGFLLIPILFSIFLIWLIWAWSMMWQSVASVPT